MEMDIKVIIDYCILLFVDLWSNKYLSLSLSLSFPTALVPTCTSLASQCDFV